MSAKYHGIKLEYREHRHTALDLLGQIRNKLQVWKGPYISPEAVRVLLQECHVSGPADAAGDFWKWAFNFYGANMLSNAGAGEHTAAPIYVGINAT